MAGIQGLFNLRYEDRRKVWFLGTVFFLAGLAEMVNYTSFMAIFNSRVGTQYLPLMYLLEALVLPLEGWLLSYLSQRWSKQRFMIAMYVLFIGIGVANGVVLLVFRSIGYEWIGFYVLLFLTSNFVVRQQTLLMWSTAFDLCPTQQAKRVMPVFVLLAIVGGIAAGIFSNVLAPVLGPEWLYMLAVLFLLAGLPNFLGALKKYLAPLTFQASADEEQNTSRSVWYYVRETLRSPFLLTVIGIMTLMPAAYFVMEYQYFTTAQSAFPNEAELTSFYGLMVFILFCAAFLLQVFGAKLIDKLGASNTIVAISAVFMGGFMMVSVLIDSPMALVAVSIGYSLTYLLLYYFAEPSYQFFFKMLPLQHRDGFRYTAQGIAASAGILLGSAVSMLHSGAGLSLLWQAVIGTVMTGLLLLLAWCGRQLYIKELVRFLQVGASTVQDFMGDIVQTMKHERVKRALMDQLRHPDETVQRVTLELFSSNPDPDATDALLQYAGRGGGTLRAQAIAAIHSRSWTVVPSEQRDEWMTDRVAEVRAAAYRQQLASADEEQEKGKWAAHACTDESPIVQVEGLRVMAESEDWLTALRRLLGEGGESAVLACEVIGERKAQALFQEVMMCLLDPRPVLRIAAVKAMGKMGGTEVAASLTEMLVGANMELRTAIEEALIDAGQEALPELTRFVHSPNDEIWRTAVTVFHAIGSDKEIRELVVPACIRKLHELRANDSFVARIEAGGQEDWIQLARLRSEEMGKSLLDIIWTVMVRFGDERSIPQIRQAVESPEEEVRDHGLEILSEGLGDSRLASALLVYYQHRMRDRADIGRRAPVAMELDSETAAATDPWLQAIAIKSGVTEGEAELVNNWEYLNALDKVVFLKQVALFEELAIEELGRIAGIAHEKRYEEGQYLVTQDANHSSLIVIVEGNVEISGTIDDGTQGTLRIVGARQTIGEAGLFDDHMSLVSAQVLFDEARVLEIEKAEMARLVRLYPEIGIGLLKSVSQRVRTMEHMLLKLG